jgi:hypothetical protein
VSELRVHDLSVSLDGYGPARGRAWSTAWGWAVGLAHVRLRRDAVPGGSATEATGVAAL